MKKFIEVLELLKTPALIITGMTIGGMALSNPVDALILFGMLIYFILLHHFKD